MSCEEQLIFCSSMNTGDCMYRSHTCTYIYAGHLGKAVVLVGKGFLVEKELAPWTLWAMLS